MTRARMPGRRRRAAVPLVIRCHRRSIWRSLVWLASDVWDFLKSPRFLP